LATSLVLVVVDNSAGGFRLILRVGCSLGLKKPLKKDKQDFEGLFETKFFFGSAAGFGLILRVFVGEGIDLPRY